VTAVNTTLVVLLLVLLLLVAESRSFFGAFSPLMAMLVGLYWARQLFRRSLDLEAFYAGLRVDSSMSRSERSDADHSLLFATLVLHATTLFVIGLQLWREFV
jgi:hypothetical protein